MLCIIEKGKYTVWSNFPEGEEPSGMKGMLDSCSESEIGVVVVCNFCEILQMNVTQPPGSYDVLVISDQKGVHLINVGAADQTSDTSDSVAKELDDILRSNFLKDRMTQFIMCHHTCNDLASVDLTKSPRPTASFAMTTSKLEELLEALVVTLNCTKSSISQDSEEETLFLLTESQCRLLWNRMHQDRTLFIHGLAGTGKTMMARIIAEHLMEKDGEDAVLYICENQPLRDVML